MAGSILNPQKTFIVVVNFRRSCGGVPLSLLNVNNFLPPSNAMKKGNNIGCTMSNGIHTVLYRASNYFPSFELIEIDDVPVSKCSIQFHAVTDCRRWKLQLWGSDFQGNDIWKLREICGRKHSQGWLNLPPPPKTLMLPLRAYYGLFDNIYDWLLFLFFIVAMTASLHRTQCMILCHKFQAMILKIWPNLGLEQ